MNDLIHRSSCYNNITEVLRKHNFQVLKTTGFFEGLFEEYELVSDNVKDRESKITFLNKVIAIVGKFVK